MNFKIWCKRRNLRWQSPYLNRPINYVESLPIGIGWIHLFKELVLKLRRMNWDGVLCDVKEKWGGLRFYTYNTTPKMDKLIHEYEQKSFDVCELCGKIGKLRTNLSWWKTLCDNCNLKNN